MKSLLLRELVINVGSVVEILGLYVAYLLGEDRWELGFSLLCICVIINNLLSRGWLILLTERRK